MRTWLLVGAVLFSGCGEPTTAASACRELVAAGVAANCRTDKPFGLAADASEAVYFDVPSTPGRGGGIFRFETDDAYNVTVKAFDDAKVLAGPFRYGNAKRRIFTQFTSDASMDLGNKAKAVIDGLHDDDGKGPAPVGSASPSAAPAAPSSSTVATGAQVATPPKTTAADACSKLAAAHLATGCNARPIASGSSFQFMVPGAGKEPGEIVQSVNDKTYGVMLNGLQKDPSGKARPVFHSDASRIVVALPSTTPAAMQAKFAPVVAGL